MTFLDALNNETQQIMSAEFSEPAIISDGATPLSLNGIYDETFITVDDKGVEVMSLHPRISFYKDAIESEFGTIKDDITDKWTVEVRGKTYRIKTVEPDGVHMVIMELSLA